MVYDIHRVKASVEASGMGSGNQRLQEQRTVGQAVVQGTRNQHGHILSLGARSVVDCERNAEIA
jgi:hypothetical protein